MTIGAALIKAKRELRAASIDSHALDAELILAHVTGRSRTELVTHPEGELSPAQQTRFAALVRRRVAREPLVHLTGSREFYGLEMIITPDVLTPRVETEQMVEWAIKYAPVHGRLIDIGTGSGAIAIAIKRHRGDLAVTGTEVSPAALAVACQNVAEHGVDLVLIASDLWADVDGVFDTIVTNLPYLRDDARDELMAEVRYEPAVALFGGADGLELYRRFLTGITGHLAPGGYLFTECDPWQHEYLIAEAARYNLEPIEQGYFILGFQRAT